MTKTPLSSKNAELRKRLKHFQYNQKQGIELTEDHLDYIMNLISKDRKAREARILDFGSWLTGKCDLHEKYTSACCGCQKARAQLELLEDYQAYIMRPQGDKNE